MCVVIDVNGEEFNVPDEVQLDSTNIRGTVRMLIAEDKLYTMKRQMKKHRKRKTNIFNSIFKK